MKKVLYSPKRSSLLLVLGLLLIIVGAMVYLNVLSVQPAYAALNVRSLIRGKTNIRGGIKFR